MDILHTYTFYLDFFEYVYVTMNCEKIFVVWPKVWYMFIRAVLFNTG